MQLVPFRICSSYCRNGEWNAEKESTKRKEKKPKNLDEFLTCEPINSGRPTILNKPKLMHFVVFFLLRVLRCTPTKWTQSDRHHVFFFQFFVPLILCVANRVDFLLCCSKHVVISYFIHREPFQFAFFMYLNF